LIETTIPVMDLALGDVITRAPITGQPVAWTLTCDPTTCQSGHMSIAMQRLPDETIIPLAFRSGDRVTVQDPPQRKAADTANATAQQGSAA
jgi:hypothetical protein